VCNQLAIVVYLTICVCVCVCVRERERERAENRPKTKIQRTGSLTALSGWLPEALLSKDQTNI